MKKIIAVILTGVITALMLTACNTTEEQTDEGLQVDAYKGEVKYTGTDTSLETIPEGECGYDPFTEILAPATEPTTTKEETTAETEANPIDELPLVPDIPATKISDDIDLTTITYSGQTFSVKGLTVAGLKSKFENADHGTSISTIIRNNNFRFWAVSFQDKDEGGDFDIESISSDGSLIKEYDYTSSDGTNVSDDYIVKGLIIQNRQNGNEQRPVIGNVLNVKMTRDETESLLGTGFEDIVYEDNIDRIMYFYQNSEAILGIKYKTEHKNELTTREDGTKYLQGYEYDVVSMIMIIYK